MTTDDTTSPRPPFGRPRLILLVFAGGVIGAATREAIVLASPTADGFPWAIFVINLLGSFALGLLVTLLGARPETPRRRDIRLFAGTGLIGGFTTYSAVAVDTTLLFEASPVVGVAYGLISVVVGVACAAAGVALASAFGRRHPSVDGDAS